MNQVQLAHYPQTLICGIDEVGRGSLAGPMLSVATLFRTWNVGCYGVTDSKELSSKTRSMLFDKLLASKELLEFGIGEVTVDEIDKMGIDQANIFSFDRAVKSLAARPNFVIVDGAMGAPGFYSFEMLVVPKADKNYRVVGAASIIAKVIRDRLMEELHKEHPDYGWDSNKGYGTKKHVNALKTYGPTIHHRKSFIKDIVQTQMELFQ